MITPVNELSDKELSDELHELGADPGPILPSTRSLYEKKLLKLRGVPEELLIASRSKRYEEVPDDEENSPPPKQRSPKPRKRVVPQKQEPEPIEPEEDESELLQDQSDTETEQTGGGVSILIKLFVFFIVAFVVYLIIKNMEPEKRIPLN